MPFQRTFTERIVLDTGCKGGFYCLEMKTRGAARVVGIDPDERYLAQAKFAAEVNGLDIEFHQLSVYDIAQLGERFDVVPFLGILSKTSSFLAFSRDVSSKRRQHRLCQSIEWLGGHVSVVSADRGSGGGAERAPDGRTPSLRQSG
jgi:SAM-dependent methyltransferase